MGTKQNQTAQKVRLISDKISKTLTDIESEITSYMYEVQKYACICKNMTGSVKNITSGIDGRVEIF